MIDVRTTDAYTNPEIASLIAQAINSECVPRSTRLNASAISEDHPLAAAAIRLGAVPFVSPTLSDRALMRDIPALKNRARGIRPAAIRQMSSFLNMKFLMQSNSIKH